VLNVDYDVLRDMIVSGEAVGVVSPLRVDDINEVAWSGSPTHLDSIASQLQRVATGEVVYYVVYADGHGVCKGGIDFAKEPGAGTIWQIATHPQLEGLGLATLLIDALEQQARHRGVHQLRLGVELDNTRARRLYEHLGFHVIGESATSWLADADDGTQFLYTTTIAEMKKSD